MEFDWIIPDRLMAGAMPTKATLSQMKRGGIDVIISLSERIPDLELLAELSMRHHHFPLPDMSAPDIGFIERFVGTLQHELDQGHRVMVHCGAGLGRTGTMLACYLVNEGTGPDEAIELVRRSRPGSVESLEQEEAVYRYANYLAGKRRE